MIKEFNNELQAKAIADSLGLFITKYKGVWQKIFDVEPEKSDWGAKGAYVQATFWELRADMVRDIKYFTAS